MLPVETSTARVSPAVLGLAVIVAALLVMLADATGVAFRAGAGIDPSANVMPAGSKDKMSITASAAVRVRIFPLAFVLKFFTILSGMPEHDSVAGKPGFWRLLSLPGIKKHNASIRR
jgi:hypothetical protein